MKNIYQTVKKEMANVKDISDIQPGTTGQKLTIVLVKIGVQK